MSKMDGIEQRGPNSWRVSVAAGRDPETGKYVRVRELVRGSVTDAKRRRDELRVQVSRGTAARSGPENVTDYLERWVSHREQLGKVRPKVAYTYRGFVRREVTPRIGSMRVAQVRPIHVQRVLDEALETGISPRSVVQVHRILHAAFRTAVRWQIIAVNPSDGVTPPKVEAPHLTMPGAGDVPKLLAAVNADYRLLLMVAAGTGLRRGETLALRWPAVELDGVRPSARVEGTLQRVGGTLEVLPPKTERSRRVVPLPPTLAGALKKHRTEQTERRLLAGPAWHPGEYVFDRGDGQPVDPDGFSKAFLRAARALGLKGVRLHDLRHAFGTALVAAGANPRIVSDTLGHSTVGFTMQVYVHPDGEAAATVAAEAERLLGG